jgi:hypothetical protein
LVDDYVFFGWGRGVHTWQDNKTVRLLFFFCRVLDGIGVSAWKPISVRNVYIGLVNLRCLIGNLPQNCDHLYIIYMVKSVPPQKQSGGLARSWSHG